MASMNGVSIKGLRYSVSNGIWNGIIYIDGKRMGIWSQDSFGGPDRFDFNEFKIRDRALDYYKRNPKVDTIKLYGKSEIDYDNLPMTDMSTKPEPEGYFLEELAQLTDLENRYKKVLKQGYTFIGKLDFLSIGQPIPKKGNICWGTSEEAVRLTYHDILGKYKYASLSVYSKLEDFILE